MAQLLVRNLEEWVKLRLQRGAQRHGRSLEDEVLGYSPESRK
jgi:plasmid stability protein